MARNITRWDPFPDFADIRARFDRMLGELGGEHPRGWSPAIDVTRDERRMVVRADIPGIAPDEVKIEVQDGVLTMSGEHEETKEIDEEDFVRRERRFGSFARSIALPGGVDAEKIEAKTRDGVLEVTIPLPDDKEPQTIEITPSAA